MNKPFRKSMQTTVPASRLDVHTIASDALRVDLKPELRTPPLPHSVPYHRVSILASEEGLLLRPYAPGSTASARHTRVSWGASVKLQQVDATAEHVEHDWSKAAVVYGLLGVVNLFTGSHLLVITSAREVGGFLNPHHVVYGLKSLSAIPLQDFTSARTVLNSILIQFNSSGKIDHYDSSEAIYTCAPIDSREDGERARVIKLPIDNDVKFTPRAVQISESSPPPSMISSGSTKPISESDIVAPLAKVLASRLSFWSKPSKVTAALDRDEREATLAKGLQDHVSPDWNDGTEEPREFDKDMLDSAASATSSESEKQRELDEKVLRCIIREFSKGQMYFSYSFDLTTALQHKQQEIHRQQRRDKLEARRHGTNASYSNDDREVDVLAEPNEMLPLWLRVTKQFWWNESLLQPFIEAGLHSYVLPVMQGFFQVSTFHIPRVPEAGELGDAALVDYIVISRRSRDRAGLRYQRRGVDDDANVANYVETETIVRVEREGSANVFSYIQIRGSIPLYWTQTGYGLKPPPVLASDRSREQNRDILRRHFSKTIPRYGPHTIVNLAEKQGKEAHITNAYKDVVTELHSKDIRYIEYDFHAETKGMKYENIGKLVANMEKVFESQGFTWFSGDRLMSEQKAVFRVNCIDCLDRTNVVQSAFARNVLNKMLSVLALWNPLDKGNTEMDIVFNGVWANNGDAISKAYAGTSALKGDYTRTGKRDIAGMLNDGMNSLARMYSSLFSDWFSQAVIDYMLGYRTLSVFSEFLLKLQSTDPRERIRIHKIRAEAIATSVSRVISDGEVLLSGWTLLSPSELGVAVSNNIEEKVLLLSVSALYIVRYDFSLEKVVRYTRVPLSQITDIKKGAYILSPLEEGSRDPMQNYGFEISYRTLGESTRLTSYSLRNVANVSEPIEPTPVSPSTRQVPRRNSSKLLLSSQLSSPSVISGEKKSSAFFKALPIDPARARRTTGSFEETADNLSWAKTCKEAVEVIVNSIAQACADSRSQGMLLVRDGDIVSLAEAQKSTTVMAKVEYGLKRLLWLGS